MKNLYIKKEECCGCGACVDVCRRGAVKMAVDREGFWYPRIEEALCVDCGQCKRVCPVKKRDGEGTSRQYFGVQAKKENTRYLSSSGGMFPVLAEYVLKKQGVVWGAAFGKNMRVAHREIRSIEELDAVKRTKYVQSSLKGVYRRIDAELKEGKWVLFAGTPCQAEGLRLYLNRFFPKLILMDLVCYGVPSPGIWGDYVKHLERKRRGRVTDFSFRDKRNKDNGHTCVYKAGGREYAGSLYRDIYCRMYFSNHTLRPSCHACRFCSVERKSDFTIGDFWGIEKVKPDMEDGMGTSVVILHTRKAREIWEEVKDSLSWFRCEEKDVLQPRLTCPTAAAESRRIFMIFYRLLPFSMFQALYFMCASAKELMKRVFGTFKR